MKLPHTIEIVCHLGANEFAPGNTYPSSQLCIDWGMDVIEIDVNTSNDGVLYVYHGPELEFNTQGQGLIMAHLAEDIDKLTINSQRTHQFPDEHLPRLQQYLQWVKGKAKLFLDVKFANLQTLIALIYELGLQNECFFWFGLPELAHTFRKLAPDLLLKVNAANVDQIYQAFETYQANIIETDFENMSVEMRDTCHALGLKFMVYYKDADENAFQQIIALEPDMINTNFGDRFLTALEKYSNPLHG